MHNEKLELNTEIEPSHEPEVEYVELVELPIEDTPIPKYTDEEHGTWGLLVKAQKENLPNRACDEYFEGLEKINFPQDKIPSLKYVSDQIYPHTGFKIMRAAGLVHPKDFFYLLEKKIFPSTDFIRKRSELKYTPAPDMFHDLFGHTPLLTNQKFADFFSLIGEVGRKAYNVYDDTHEIHNMMARTYWFTVEFGLTNTKNGIRVYGSGQISSPEEIVFCLTDKCKKRQFSMEEITNQPYDIWHMQREVFVIDSWEQLINDFHSWSVKKKII